MPGLLRQARRLLTPRDHPEVRRAGPHTTEVTHFGAAFFGPWLNRKGMERNRASPVYSSSFNAANPCSPAKSDVASVRPSRVIAFFSQYRALR